ncbi:MAG: c-type cytochrome [Rhizobiaceae bacterium]|nr:c-type cytochrome [Rhizobiaceae bacterium]
MAKHLVQLTLAAVLAFAASPAFAEGDIKKGEKIFKKCRACHEVGDAAKIKLGPVLNNVFGATLGTNADYADKYSKAMKKKGEEGVVWNAETLNDFLTKPKKYIKKTKMAFAGIKKDKQREDLLAFLIQYSPDYTPAE